MYKILTISCIASCMLNTALGENNQFLKKWEISPSYLKELESSSSGLKLFSSEERKALYHYINQDYADKFRLMAGFLKCSQEGEEGNPAIDLVDPQFLQGLKGVVEKGINSDWFPKLPIFYQKQIKIQYEELLKITQNKSKQVTLDIAEKLLDNSYGSRSSNLEYLKELQKYGFRNNDDLFNRFSNYNLTLARKAVTAVSSKLSASHGYAEAFLEIAKILEKETEENEYSPSEMLSAMIIKKATQGSMNAQNVLGLYYLQGLGGCPQNFKKASEWLKKAAEQGCESAKKTLDQLPLQLK